MIFTASYYNFSAQFLAKLGRQRETILIVNCMCVFADKHCSFMIPLFPTRLKVYPTTLHCTTKIIPFLSTTSPQLIICIKCYPTSSWCLFFLCKERMILGYFRLWKERCH